MRRIILATFGILLLGTLGGIAWLGANDAPAQSAGGRRAILEESIKRVARPGIDRVVAAVGQLKTSARLLSESPSAENVTACQAAWRHAHKAWKQFVPASGACGLDTTLLSEISYWPAFASSIENVVKSPRPLDPAFFEILGAGAKGFYALEHLLFDLPDGNTGKIGNAASPKKPRLSATDLLDGPTAARRRAYVLGLCEHLANRCESLQRSLHEPELPAQWAARGQDALNQLVNHLVEILEVGGVGRIARQLELLDQGRLTCEAVEGMASGASIAAFSALIEGAEQLYTGADGPGVDDEARAMNPELAGRLQTQFQRSHSAIAALQTSFDEAILKNRVGVEQALAEIRARGAHQGGSRQRAGSDDHLRLERRRLMSNRSRKLLKPAGHQHNGYRRKHACESGQAASPLLFGGAEPNHRKLPGMPSLKNRIRTDHWALRVAESGCVWVPLRGRAARRRPSGSHACLRRFSQRANQRWTAVVQEDHRDEAS